MHSYTLKTDLRIVWFKSNSGMKKKEIISVLHFGMKVLIVPFREKRKLNALLLIRPGCVGIFLWIKFDLMEFCIGKIIKRMRKLFYKFV